MPKYIYIAVAAFLAYNFIPSIIPNIKDISFILSYGWILFGMYTYRNAVVDALNSSKNKKWVYIILFLFVISCIAPELYFDQPFHTTLITIRPNYTIFYLNVLLMMKPSESDFYKAFMFLGVLAMILMVVGVIKPELFMDEEAIEKFIGFRDRHETTDFFLVLPGFQAIVMLFFFSANRLIKKQFTKHDLLLYILSFAFIMIAQNRSTLLIVVPTVAYIFFKTKFRFKPLLIALIVVASSLYIIPIISGLIEESQSQLNDADYNRWKAIDYFTYSWDYNPFTLLFGNGFPGGTSSYLKLITTAKENGCYASDLGMIGTFFYDGLLLVGIIYTFVFKGLRRSNPLYLRLYSAWILLVPTIHMFGNNNIGSVLSFVTFFYLVIYYDKLSESNKRRYTQLSYNKQSS